jgi:hypothetical protein
MARSKHNGASGRPCTDPLCEIRNVRAMRSAYSFMFVKFNILFFICFLVIFYRFFCSVLLRVPHQCTKRSVGSPLPPRCTGGIQYINIDTLARHMHYSINHAEQKCTPTSDKMHYVNFFKWCAGMSNHLRYLPHCLHLSAFGPSSMQKTLQALTFAG